MEIPMIKTLLKFRDYENVKTVLCDFLTEGDSKFGAIELKNSISDRNPFKTDEYYECIQFDDGNFGIRYYDKGYKHLKTIDVIVKHVLVFKGKVFELKETSYDMEEYEDEDY